MLENNNRTEPKYQLVKFLAYAEGLFNCRPEVLVGALYNYHQTEFTIDEMRCLIHNYLNRQSDSTN